MPSWVHNMDSPPMHYAWGMVIGGALWLVVVIFRPRSWVYWPLAMTMGGVWAEVPDLALVFKLYPSLGFGRIRAQPIYDAMHGPVANLFCFHGWLDRSGNGGWFAGWVVTVTLYGAWAVALAVYVRRLRRRADGGAE